MEPLSAAASIIGVLDVALRTTSALIQYAHDAKGASNERQVLAEEANCLLTILQQLLDRSRSAASAVAWNDTRMSVAQQFRRAYDELAAVLRLDVSSGQIKSESRLKALRTSAKWSFNKSEVYALIERISRLQQYASMMLQNDQSDLLESLDQRQQQSIVVCPYRCLVSNRVGLVADDMVKTAVLSWLSPLQMPRVHQSIVERAQQGSGRWLLNSEQFLDWRSGKERLLWCYGMPGAGKTIITSIVVDQLRHQRTHLPDNTRIAVAVIYLKYNDPEHSISNLLGSLLKQLVQELPSLPSSVERLYNLCGEIGTPPSLNEILDALMGLLELYSQTFFVIDALDECNDEVRWALIGKLRALQPEIRLLILSRFRGDIDEELNDFKRLEIKAHRADIELFIDAQIEKNAKLRRIIEKSPSLRGDIKEAVVKTAKEMFLLARLHVESLASAAALSTRHVRNRLKVLPTTLMSTYDEAISRIGNQDDDCKSIAFKTLAWVNHAFRPLSLRELQHALAVEPGGTELDEELIMDEGNITALCAGLIVVDLGTQAVSFVHYTAYNYFEEKRQAYFPNFHGSITMSCATYLTMPALQNATIWVIVRRYPLACYAAQFMGDHARQNPEETLEPSVLETVYQLLAHSGKRKPLLSLLDGLDLIRSGFYSPSNSKAPQEDYINNGDDIAHHTATDSELTGSETSQILEVTALHLAASMGLAKVASMLVKEHPDIDAVDETGKTALAVAIERGFEKAVEFLVNSGARVDLREEHGQQVLLLLVEKGWDMVADTVTERAKANAAENDKNVNILIAAYAGNVEDLSRHSNQQNINEGAKSTAELALFLAVEHSDVQMVKALLSLRVDVNSEDSTGQTSLHRATRRECETTMRILLDSGAKIDAINDKWLTPWSANANSRNDKILGILLAAGANPNIRDHDGATMLYGAAAGGHVDMVRFLLKSGTNPSLKTSFDWAPMHWASYHGHIECVKLLVAAGAELNPISDQNMTPLDLAFKNNQGLMSDFLVKHGAKEAKEVPKQTYQSATFESEDTEGFVHITEITDALTIAESGRIGPDMWMTLTFDRPLQQSLETGQFIYPDWRTSNISNGHDYSGEENQPYQISHMLDALVPAISIRRSTVRPTMDQYPLPTELFVSENVLYDIERVGTDGKELELRGISDSSFTGIVRMRRGWSGGWKAHHDHGGSTDLLFRTTPEWSESSSEDQGSRWTTENGRLLARTGDGLECKMRVGHALDPKLLDVLVACWIAKVWSDTLTRHNLQAYAGSK